MVEMPTEITKATDLTREQVNFGIKRLPSISVQFVEIHCPDAVKLAKAYDRARDKFLHYGPVKGEGYVFDPKLYAKAVKALETLLAEIPGELIPEWSYYAIEA